MPAGADSSPVPAAAYWGKTLDIVVVDTEAGSCPQVAVDTGADNWPPKAAGNCSPQAAGTVWVDTDWDHQLDCFAVNMDCMDYMDFDRS